MLGTRLENMFKHTILFAAVVGLVFALAPAAQAALIAGGNGSFEVHTYSGTGGVYGAGIWLADTEGSASGWTFDFKAWFATTSYDMAPQDGSYFVNLHVDSPSGMSPGTMSAPITDLTSGSTYDVLFWVSNRAGTVGTQSITATVNTTTPTTLTVLSSDLPTTTGSPLYALQALTFTATAPSQTLTVSAAPVAGDNLLLDNFTVIPEPATLALLGLGGLGLLLRRKQR